MPNNPVQIVLNTENYIQRTENSPGGGSKDFYAGMDESFIAHKEKLIQEIESIQGHLLDSDYKVNYAHVILSNEAWAKSHRPVQRIFPENKIHHVGGGTIGEMLVELTLDNIQGVVSSISSAEEKTRWDYNKQGKLIAKPSRVRSETGGIREIRIHGSADRRKFSAEQAVDWLSDSRTGGMYIVQTFITSRDDESRLNQQQLFVAQEELSKLFTKLESLEFPVSIEETSDQWKSFKLILVKPNIDYSSLTHDESIQMHQKLLSVLDSDALVRRVMLPPIINKSHVVTGTTNSSSNLPLPQDGIDYPIVGIIDTGVDENGVLAPWVVGRTDLLDADVQDFSHGTFIGGLTAIGNSLNSNRYLQESPCKIFDLGLHATDPDQYSDYYPRGFIDFLEQLDVEIGEAKKSGVRIFNMSLSIEQLVQDSFYSLFAAQIDEISDRHDVLVVLPAGNLNESLSRSTWPEAPVDAVQMFADYRHQGMDRIFQPADSIRSIVVGALSPPVEADPRIVPAEYTRRGPGTALGVKPDVAHIGGRFNSNSGLFSIDTDGSVVEACGTSYAAPLVAKTMATLENSIEGNVPRETLIGLIVHNSEIPESINHKSLKHIAKDLVGHGIPEIGSNLLQTEDHAITLVFTGNIIGRHELVFPFSWPTSLVSPEGKCRGKVRMTLAYTPITNLQYEAEYIRVNVDAYLRQEKVNINTGAISYKGFFDPDSSSVYEKERIEHGQKWWPVKRREKTSTRGVGTSSQWRLVVDSLTRAGEIIPEEGIPFSVILTIEDPKKSSPIFNELRRTLQASGANVYDIRTAQRIQPRS
jgi:hypothetical protein